MPILNTEMKTYKTLNGLGGAITATESVSGQSDNLVDTFDDTETADGKVIYACAYIKNTNATLQASNVRFFIDTETVHAGVNVEVGLGAAAVNGTEQTIADEESAPNTPAINFVEADGAANALVMGDLPAEGHRAFWVKITVAAGTAAKNNYLTAVKILFGTPE